MNNYRCQHCGSVFTAVISLIIFVFVSCGDTVKKSSTDTWDDSKVTYTSVTADNTYSFASGDTVFYPETTGDADLTYSLTLDAAKKVYFIFSNSNTGSATTLPYSPNIRSADQTGSSGFEPKPDISISSSAAEKALRGKPEITEYNHNALNLMESSGRSVLDPGSASEPVKSYTPNESSENFSTSDGTINATCRMERIGYGKTLYIWVDNNSWGTTPGKVDQTLVINMADAFLIDGQNKIYEWVTNIFGAEWGTHSRTNMIAANQPIHILLYDIDKDGAPVPGDSYTVGYFWAKDNYIKSSAVSNSNEKIMFYMDAALYASGYDYWEDEIISTLAHEFQHMINFYQKTVLRSARSETWLDEMCALMAEDFVADKLQLDGPRGVAYNIYTAGSANNTNGRLPRFNYYNDTPVTAWLDGDDVLASYSTAYAFGAYLARNFGGAPLFKEIVQSTYGDHNAVTNAISDSGYKTFQALLRDWGVSVVLSDKTTSLPDSTRYGFNSGAAFDSTSVISYSLGSINLYNYNFTDSDPNLTRPWFSNGIADQVYQMNQGSNFYSYMGTLNGSNEWTVRLRSGVSLTVVVRD